METPSRTTCQPLRNPITLALVPEFDPAQLGRRGEELVHLLAEHLCGHTCLFLLQLIQQVENLLVERNIAHGFAIVLVADLPRLVHNEHGRHPSQLEQIDLLPVLIGYRVLRIGQAGKGKRFLFPCTLKRSRPVRPNDEHLSAPRHKLSIVLAQLRQMPAAVGSRESACKYQHQVLLPPIIAEADPVAPGILKSEIRCECSDLVGHGLPPLQNQASLRREPEQLFAHGGPLSPAARIPFATAHVIATI